MDNARAAEEKGREAAAWCGDTERFGGPSPLSLALVSLISSQPASWLSGGKTVSGFVSAGGQAGHGLKKFSSLKRSAVANKFHSAKDFSGGQGI